MRLDPRQSMLLMNAIAALFGVSATLVLAMWAVSSEARPPANLGPLVASASGIPTVAEPHQPSFDMRPFTVNLWQPKPLPQAAASPSASAVATSAEQPLNFQLIGVTKEGEKLVAALYDVEHDQLLLVADGDRIGALTVARTTLESVALLDGTRVRELRMKRSDQ